MGELRNDFSWSWSRHRTFASCPRKYWYTHYGAWGAWRPTDDPELRELYIQKKLTTTAQWLGSMVHEAAEWVLKEALDSRLPAVSTVVSRYKAAARRAISDSEQGLYRYNALKYTAFSEHYYGDGDEAVDWDGTVEELLRQVEGLFGNRIFRRLLDVPERICEVEQLEQLWISGVPVWVSIDVLVRDADGGYVVIDWKTGRSHTDADVADQLGVYGLYVTDRYLQGERDVGRVKTLYANLRTSQHRVWTLDRQALRRANERIMRSAEQMRAAVGVPGSSPVSRERFPRLEEGNSTCERCRFRRSCGRENA